MSLLPSTPDTSPPDDADPRVIGVDSDDADEVLSALSSETARKLLSALYEDPGPPSELADRVDTSLQNAQYHLEKLERAGAVAVVDTAYSTKGREMDVYAPADRPLVVFAGDDDDGSLLRSALARLLGAVGVLGLASLAVQQLFGRRPLFGGGGDGTLGTGGGGGAPATGDESSAPADGGESDGGAGADVTSSTSTPDAEAFDGGVADTVTPTGGDDVAAATSTPGGDGGGAMSVEGTPDAATQTPQATEAAGNVTATAADAVANATETATATADATREAAAGLPPGLLFFAGGLFAIAAIAGALYLRR